MGDNLGERLATVETKVANIENQIDDLGSINKSIERLTTLMEVQVSENEKRDAMREKQAIALEQLSVANIKTSEALDRLNTKIDKTDAKLESLNKKVDETSKKGTFNWIDLITSKAIPFLLSAGVTYWILKTVGIIK